MTEINIKFPIEHSPRGAFATNDSTLDAVADDLRILLLTNHGDRPIHYDFGANLRSVIFEQQGETLRQSISDLITSAVERWMPYVRLIRIEVEDSTTKSTVKDNEVWVFIEFSVGTIDITRTLRQRVRT